MASSERTPLAPAVRLRSAVSNTSALLDSENYASSAERVRDTAEAVMKYQSDGRSLKGAGTRMSKKAIDPGFEGFDHEPELYYDKSVTFSEARIERKRRAHRRQLYPVHNNTIAGGILNIFFGELRPATVCSSSRLVGVMAFHLTIGIALATGYFFIELDTSSDGFLNGIKDFVDLCVTGIVFLLGGFVSTMINRWWSYRTECCGGLHQACTNLALVAAAQWPTASAADREARGLVTRYSLAAYQLLFVEARALDLATSHAEERGESGADIEGVARAVRSLVKAGTLTEAEVAVLAPLPIKSAVVIGWLTAFWDRVLAHDARLACTANLPRNVDNGRYSVVYGQLFAARNAISLCHMYMQTQLPYGYIHLILIVVHLTCLANTLFCGIHLGQILRATFLDVQHDDNVQIAVPLVFVRLLRIVFVPLLLDGMLLIGSVIAMPLGDDEDDFPAGAFLEALEDECLAPGAALEQYHPADHLSTKVMEL